MSDTAKVYASGKEPAVLTTVLTVPAANGKELAHAGNGNLAHDYKDDRTR